MSRQLHTGWLDTVATDPNSHCKEACCTLRTSLKTKYFVPLGNRIPIPPSFIPQPIHGADYWAVRLLHLQGFQLKTEPRRTASLTALHFCMLCISTVSTEELPKILIICSPGDKCVIARGDHLQHLHWHAVSFVVTCYICVRKCKAVACHAPGFDF